VSFLAVLFLIFLILKLTHYIDWSWWWVFAPLIGEVAVDLVVWFVGVSFFVWIWKQIKVG
jgi:hypothetical protein